MPEIDYEPSEIEHERFLTREQVAEQLEALAGALREGGPVEVGIGDVTATTDPTETLKYEVEVENEMSLREDGIERSIEIELEWIAQEGELPNE